MMISEKSVDRDLGSHVRGGVPLCVICWDTVRERLKGGGDLGGSEKPAQEVI